REEDVPCEHDWQTKVTEPTCTKGGYTTRFCNKCFESEQIDPTEPLGHDFDDGVITKQPTSMFDGVKTFTCRRCGETYKESIPKLPGGDSEIIDFKNPADNEKYEIIGETEGGAPQTENGRTITCTVNGIEPSIGQNGTANPNLSEAQSNTPENLIEIPIEEGDWTASLKFHFEPNGGSGAWAFLGFYAAQGDDYQNMVGIRGGDGAFQDFIRTDGNITADTDLASSPGFSSANDYYFQIQKTGTTYVCSRSNDAGENFEEMFSFEDTGINAEKLIIDAYSGRGTGFSFTLDHLIIEGVGGGDTQWVETDTVESGKMYLVVADEKYAMNGSTDAIGATPVTIEGNKVTSEVTEDMVWFFDPAEGVDPAADGSDLYFITTGDGLSLRRGSGNAPMSIVDYDAANSRYFVWSLIERENVDEGYTLYQNGSSRYALTGAETGFSVARVSSSSGNIQTAGSGIKLYTLSKGDVPQPAKPEVSGITVDGKALEGFDPKVKTYAVGVADSVTAAPEVAATAGNEDTTITVTQAAGIPGEAVIEAKAGEKTLTYTVSFDYGPKDDYFADGAMNEGQWTILNEVKDPTEEEPFKYYKFEKGVGLVMPTQHNSIYQKATPGAWSNMFTMSGGGDWEVVAKAFYPAVPQGNYQQVQFIAWQDEDNYVRINCQDSRQRIEPFYEKAGTAVNQNGNALNNAISAAEDGTMTMYFKINKAGNTYTITYSEDGKEWKSGGVYEADLTNVKVAVFCTQDYQPTQSNYVEPVELAFEYVAVTGLNGETVKTDEEMLTWAAQNAADYIAADLPARTTEDLVLSPAPHGYTVELDTSDLTVIAANGKVTQPDKTVVVDVTVAVTEGDTTAFATKAIRVDGKSSASVNTEALEAAIAAGDAVDKSKFTPETVALFEQALASAKIALGAEDQKTIDDAAKALQDAIAALEPIEVPVVDKKALNEAITKADAVDPKQFTEDTAKALADALENAKAVQAKADATQEEVNAAADALNAAIDALEPFRFDDVKDENKFYFDPVYWAYYAEPQITNGKTATTFGPDDPCTRGHVVTFLWRAAGEPEPKSTKTPFTDLKPGAFYEKAVAWAVEEGITKGMTDTTFAPDGKCNRGQIVTFLWRFKGEPAPKSTQTPFTDLKPGAFYEKAVAWAVENDVTKGMTETTFGPDATCTRGQVVTFLFRATKG
ncbi:MAG: hypothetical protein E7424_07095, partial [Ruminococcaceae bacterium]|nr:hypothetical protein [Oscillospiraceae bacterium]